jgi:hypothetical protein
MRCSIGDVIRDIVYDRDRHTAGFEGVDVEWYGEERVPVDVEDVSRGDITAAVARGNDDFRLAG